MSGRVRGSNPIQWSPSWTPHVPVNYARMVKYDNYKPLPYFLFTLGLIGLLAAICTVYAKQINIISQAGWILLSKHLGLETTKKKKKRRDLDDQYSEESVHLFSDDMGAIKEESDESDITSLHKKASRDPRKENEYHTKKQADKLASVMDEKYYSMFKSKIKKRVAPEIQKSATVRELRRRKAREKIIEMSRYMPKTQIMSIGKNNNGEHADYQGVPGVRPKDRYTVNTGGATLVNRARVLGDETSEVSLGRRSVNAKQIKALGLEAKAADTETMYSGGMTNTDFDTSTTLLGRKSKKIRRVRKRKLKEAKPQEVKDDNFFRLMFALGLSENMKPRSRSRQTPQPQRRSAW